MSSLNTNEYWVIKTNYWLILLAVSLLNLLAVYLVSKVLWNDQIYFDNFTGSNFSKYIDSVRTIDFYRYCLTPFYIAGKSIFIAILLAGALFLFVNTRVDLLLLCKIALVAEMAFIASDYIKVFWFEVIITNYSSADIKEFYPLSLYSLMNVDSEWSFALKALNIFHVFYILIFCWLLQRGRPDLLNIHRILFLSYFLLLLLWILVMMFIGLSFSND